MKFKTKIGLALVLSVLLSGCSTAKPICIIPQPDRAGIELPVKLRDYREVYAFIAKHEGVPTDADSLLKLAADSETEIYPVAEPLASIWVITPRFYDGGIYDQIRGAQGNGGIYVLRPSVGDSTSGDFNHGFELVGVAEGNVWSFSIVNGKPRLITNWHISAAEHPENIYDWNGRFFAPSKP